MLRAEKTACEKIEQEYNEILMQKQAAFEFERDARVQAELRANNLE